MAKKLWYDIFGNIYKRDVALEISQQLREELEAVKRQLYAGCNAESEVINERDRALAEVKRLQGKLDKIAGISQKMVDTNQRRTVGRPRILHVMKHVAVDLDTSLVLDMLHEASSTSWTRLVNDILRDWLNAHHPGLYKQVLSAD
jgi:uncharacterized protein (DUF4415 family)